jgi:tetraacyldisaccharide 4'-kinase
MDDGLQNPALRKDISLAVIDGGAGFGNGCVFPAGPLRAPVADQRAAVGATLLVGAGERGRKAAQELSRPPLFTASLRPDAEAARRLAGRRVLAMAGIGRPEKFVATLEACGAEVAATRFIGDHEPYSGAMLAEIAAASERNELLVATTEKDAARIGPNAPAALATRWLVVPVTLVFDDAPALSALLAQALSAARG